MTDLHMPKGLVTLFDGHGSPLWPPFRAENALY
jgi:hypothetical protein